MQVITSRHNARIKQAAKLRRRREREKQGRFLIDGTREILRAIAAGIEIDEAFVLADAGEETSADEQRAEVVAALDQCGAMLSIVMQDVLEKLSFGDRAEGVVAVARTPQRSLDGLRLPERPLVAVIEGLEKPGNVGAVLRSADGAGVDAVIVADPLTDLFNANAIRASLGTVFSKSVCTAPSKEALAWLLNHDVAMFAARPDAEQNYASADYTSSAAIVLGSEADGLSPNWRQDDVLPVRLPMLGIADSLNVSAAAAAMFYEARRQRDAADDVS